MDHWVYKNLSFNNMVLSSDQAWQWTCPPWKLHWLGIFQPSLTPEDMLSHEIHVKSQSMEQASLLCRSNRSTLQKVPLNPINVPVFMVYKKKNILGSRDAGSSLFSSISQRFPLFLSSKPNVGNPAKGVFCEAQTYVSHVAQRLCRIESNHKGMFSSCKQIFFCNALK